MTGALPVGIILASRLSVRYVKWLTAILTAKPTTKSEQSRPRKNNRPSQPAQEGRLRT